MGAMMEGARNKWNVVALGIVLMTGPAFAVGPEKSENDENDNFGELLIDSDESKPCRRPSCYMNGNKTMTLASADGLR